MHKSARFALLGRFFMLAAGFSSWLRPSIAIKGSLMQHIRFSSQLSASSVVETDAQSQSAASMAQVDLPTNENNPNLLKIRHSTAHVMAMAVQKLFPSVRVTIGPWIDNG